jgi:hypothetical protein
MKCRNVFLKIVAMILVSTPCLGQMRVWTNADLNRPLTMDRPAVDPVALSGMRSREYKPLPTESGVGPLVVVIRSSVFDGPYGPFPAWPVSPPLNCCGLYVNGVPVYGADGDRSWVELARMGLLAPYAVGQPTSARRSHQGATPNGPRTQSPVGGQGTSERANHNSKGVRSRR